MSRNLKDAGFTLVEILAVLAIIGLMSSVVILTMPKPKSALDIQANKLTTALNALAQDGLISGQVNAAGFSKDGYSLYTYREGQWVERASGEWADSYRLKFTRGTAKIDIPKKTVPTLLFQPTGLSTPFELTLSDRDMKYTLKTAGDGRVMLVKSVP